MQLDSQAVPLRSVKQHRPPAVPIAICFACGIAFDRWLGLPYHVWLISGVVLAVAWIVSVRMEPGERRRIGLWFLLLGCVIVGGARHHREWSVGRVDDISLFAQQQKNSRSQPIRLVATIESQPKIIPKKESSALSAWQKYDRSDCIIRCHSIRVGYEQVAVTGMAKLNVTGHLLHVAYGDRVEIVGSLSRPVGKQNPGGFDYRAYLQEQCIRCVVHTEYPDAIRLVESRSEDFLSRYRNRIREECEGLFVKHLSPRTVPIASAILLGSRSHLHRETRASFAESGTMHLLAISGLHVGILAAFFWFCCRLLNLSPLGTSFVLLMGIGCYAFLTEARPPVIRATILIFITAVAWPRYRRVSAANTLAIAAIIVLMFRPTDLFNVGAQLSFLAVIAIIWSARWLRSRDLYRKNQKSTLDVHELTVTSSWLRMSLRELLVFLKQGYIMTAAIWLFAAPLIAATFHLISPIGLVINVLLVPIVVITLWMGYGFLLSGLLVPWLAGIFGTAFDFGLNGLLDVTAAAARIEWGHTYVPGTPAWWLAGFYLLLSTVVFFRSDFLTTHWGWRGLWGWMIVGLTVSLSQPQPTGLRCTFLSVGHGCSVLIELPSGKTVLYDAGMINDGDRAAQIVQSALWQRGRTRIDALIVSHADIDHFNAVPGLLQKVPVGRLLLSQPFLDFDQQGVVEVCERASKEGVPISLVASGDRLLMDDAVELQVIHPQRGFTSSRDNANSVVLQVEYEGKQILLTGDLEEEGLENVLTKPSQKIDVLMSPHHGSIAANTESLAAWATPRWVVVSKGRRGNLKQLQDRYGPDVRVLSTNESGAITFEIKRGGVIECSTVLEETTSVKREQVVCDRRKSNVFTLLQR